MEKILDTISKKMGTLVSDKKGEKFAMDWGNALIYSNVRKNMMGFMSVWLMLA